MKKFRIPEPPGATDLSQNTANNNFTAKPLHKKPTFKKRVCLRNRLRSYYTRATLCCL